MNRIRQLREERDMTQKELGKLLQVQSAAVSKYEVGRISLTDNLIKQLCKVFDVSADYLLGLTNLRGSSKKNDAPLTQEQGERIIQSALKDTGLLDENGGLSEKGEKTVSEFLRSNAQILKKLLDK